MEDTIVALASPAGRAGVAIIRMSGPKVLQIACVLARKTQFAPRKAVYTSLYTAEDIVIDTVIIIYFKAPHSFTGEDIIEIHGHGSPVLLDDIIHQCLIQGARVAEPGEFSKRAFLNDKMDLAQAEAVADLIGAHSLKAARMAVRSLQGSFSTQIHALNESIIYLRLFVEAAIDFPDEEVDFLSDGKVLLLLDKILHTLADIRLNAVQGVLMREGLTIVIAGRPNAGKSTLINALAGYEVAIVTDIAGTTRDVLREHILVDDIPVHIIDTAGLRESQDVVEKEGIKRAWHAVGQADCVLMIVDINQADEDFALKESIQEKLQVGVPIITVCNKIDVHNLPAKLEDNTVYLSAKTGEGMDFLKQAIKSAVGFQSAEGTFLARRRHLEAIDAAQEFLLAGHAQLNKHRSGELLAEDLKQAHAALSEITGEFSADDLLGKIFSSFCIGK